MLSRFMDDTVPVWFGIFYGVVVVGLLIRLILLKREVYRLEDRNHELATALDRYVNRTQ